MKLHFQQYYWRWSKNLFLYFTLCTVLLTLMRVIFIFIFGDLPSLFENTSELLRAIFLGVRFDIMPLAYVFAIPFLLLNIGYFLPGKKTIRAIRWISSAILTSGLILVTWLFVIDYAFYSYFQEHINVLFFGLFEDDTMALAQTIWKNYNVTLWVVLGILTQILFSRLTKVMFSPFDFDLDRKKHHLRYGLSFVLGLVFLAFAARGTFTRLPLSIEDAHISHDDFINDLSLNGAITLNRAIKIRKVFGQGEYRYLTQNNFQSWQEAFQVAFGKAPTSASLTESLMQTTPINPTLEARKPHVVMLVMESFGSYWNDVDNVEFDLLGELRNHLPLGLHFPHFLPAENGTIGSMVSISTSQVIRPGARFLSESGFMSTNLRSSVNTPYQEQGYETHFIYGGKLGWRQLGKYLSVQKFDRLWGADEIKESMPELANIDNRDLGNEWGIFDEYLYSFIEENLRTATKPQFFLVLTTSNHPPFEYPTTYKPLPVVLTKERMNRITFDEELAMKRFLALQSANQKLGEFLTRLKSGPLRDKLVLGMTGDHSYWVNKGVGNSQEFKRWAVPFFISVPEGMKKNVDLTHFGSHEDIFPTLYNLTLSDQTYIGLGEDMIASSGIAQNSSGLYAGSEGAFHHGKFWKWKDKTSLLLEETAETPELAAMKKKAKAMIAITDRYLKEEKANTPTVLANDQQ